MEVFNETKKRCKNHPNSELLGYCSQDNEFICSQCLKNHRKHEIFSMEEIIEYENALVNSKQIENLKVNYLDSLNNYVNCLQIFSCNILDEISNIKLYVKELNESNDDPNTVVPDCLYKDIDVKFEKINKNKELTDNLHKLSDNLKSLKTKFSEISLNITSFDSLNTKIFYCEYNTSTGCEYDIKTKSIRTFNFNKVSKTGWTRFFYLNDDLYCGKGFENAALEKLDLNNSTVNNHILSKNNNVNLSIIGHENFIYLIGHYECEIFDIKKNNSIESIKIAHTTQMPAGAVFSNKFIYLFGDQGVECLDLKNKNLGFQKINTNNGSFVNPLYYANVIQVDESNILVFEAFSRIQSFLFNVETKTFKETKNIPDFRECCFFNTSQPIIYNKKVYVIDEQRPKTLFLYDIIKQEWTTENI